MRFCFLLLALRVKMLHSSASLDNHFACCCCHCCSCTLSLLCWFDADNDVAGIGVDKRHADPTVIVVVASLRRNYVTFEATRRHFCNQRKENLTVGGGGLHQRAKTPTLSGFECNVQKCSLRVSLRGETGSAITRIYFTCFTDAW